DDGEIKVRTPGFMFFFSSRRRHTRWPRDWSSDVCSSDLRRITDRARARQVILRPRERDEPGLGRAVEVPQHGPEPIHEPARGLEIGRASGRERVENWGVVAAREKKNACVTRRQACRN